MNDDQNRTKELAEVILPAFLAGKTVQRFPKHDRATLHEATHRRLWTECPPDWTSWDVSAFEFRVKPAECEWWEVRTTRYGKHLKDFKTRDEAERWLNERPSIKAGSIIHHVREVLEDES